METNYYMWILSPAGTAVLSHKPVYLKDLKCAANRDRDLRSSCEKKKVFERRKIRKAASCRFGWGVLWCHSVFAGKVRSWQRLMLCLETFTEVGGFDGQGFNIEWNWRILKYHDNIWHIGASHVKLVLDSGIRANMNLVRGIGELLYQDYFEIYK